MPWAENVQRVYKQHMGLAERAWNTPPEEAFKGSGAPLWQKIVALPAALGHKYLKETVDALKRSMYTGETKPTDAMLLAGLAMGGGAGGAPKRVPGTTDVGMLKGIGRTERKVIRGLMKEEMKARGPWKGMPKVGEASPTDLIDTVARGTWFHGRQTYPRGRAGALVERSGAGNLGEPVGLSLSAKSSVAGRFSRRTKKQQGVIDKLQETFERANEEVGRLAHKEKLPWDAPELRKATQRADLIRDKLFEMHSNQFARAVPLFGAPPRDVILPGWKGGGAEGVLKDAYGEAARKTLAKKGVQERLGDWSTAELTTANMKDLFDASLPIGERRKFNAAMTSELQGKGYKGLLYHPQRGGYGEYELRMFSPEDVLLADLRRSGDKGLGRLEQEWTFGGSTAPHRKATELWEQTTKDLPPSLRAIWEDVDLAEIAREILLRSESPKELLPIMYGFQDTVPQRTLLKQWDRLGVAGKRALERSRIKETPQKKLSWIKANEENFE